MATSHSIYEDKLAVKCGRCSYFVKTVQIINWNFQTLLMWNFYKHFCPKQNHMQTSHKDAPATRSTSASRHMAQLAKHLHWCLWAIKLLIEPQTKNHTYGPLALLHSEHLWLRQLRQHNLMIWCFCYFLFTPFGTDVDSCCRNPRKTSEQF